MTEAENTAAIETGADDELSYEAARDELVEVVRRLESGGTTLKESMELWERGEKLADTCQRWLDGAKARIDAARARDEG
ncbi:hypothetical protein GCM10027418_17330 [Mariniluteicoccus endophyticus]